MHPIRATRTRLATRRMATTLCSATPAQARAFARAAAAQAAPYNYQHLYWLRVGEALAAQANRENLCLRRGQYRQRLAASSRRFAALSADAGGGSAALVELVVSAIVDAVVLQEDSDEWNCGGGALNAIAVWERVFGPLPASSSS